ncbi:MAG: hypothetical protein NTU48_06910 [Legionellales bacterium]|nr:hypothetical protein [Legionellales bacterium]
MKANACKTSSNCGHKIFGWVAVAVGVVSAVMTQSWEAFTLGWFFVAAALFCGKKNSCGSCNGCGACVCCCDGSKEHTHSHGLDVSCEMPAPAVKVKKAAAPRKNAKKKTT